MDLSEKKANMQFIKFSSLQAIATILALAVVSNGSPVAEDTGFVGMTDAQMDNWLATTDAELTFINDAGVVSRTPSPRAALSTRVVYCSTRTGPICGGACTVYNGGATCLNAPDTKCLTATNNVGFCDKSSCKGSCNLFNSCGTRLDNNFCYTPGTKSINVPFT